MSDRHPDDRGLDIETVERHAQRASQLLKAMSNRHRLLVLCQLSAGEKSVGELEKVVGLSQSALSQHLARLRRENLVKTRRQAQTIFYSLDGDAAAHLIDAIVRVYGGRPLARRAADDGARGRAACG